MQTPHDRPSDDLPGGSASKLAVIDRHLRVMWASPTLQSDVKSPNVVGRPAGEVLLHGNHIEQWVRRAFSSKSPIQAVQQVHPDRFESDEQPVVVRIECHPLIDSEGQVAQVAVLLQDATHEALATKRARAAERHAELHAALVQNLRDQREVLAQVLSAAATPSTLEELCLTICRRIRTFFNADRCWLISQRHGDRRLHLIAEDTAPEWPGAYAAGEDVDAEPMRDLWELVLSSPEPLAVDESWPEAQNDIFRKYHIRSHLTVAVRPSGEQVWVFGMHQCSHPRIWTEEEKAFLGTLGQAVTLMLEREQVGLRAEEQKRQFYRDVVYAVTQGKLVLCEATDFPEPPEHGITAEVTQPSDITAARRLLRQWLAQNVPNVRDCDGVILAIGEAVTNAYKHAGGGVLRTWSESGRVYARVTDSGSGIEPGMLPMAMLMPGFSTKVSLGMGFTIMLDAATQLQLATGPGGTTVQLEFALEGELDAAAILDKWTESSS
ncbi:MAG: ATP-binding protein [Armatimonadota bacterium]